MRVVDSLNPVGAGKVILKRHHPVGAEKSICDLNPCLDTMPTEFSVQIEVDGRGRPAIGTLRGMSSACATERAGTGLVEDIGATLC